MKQQRLAQILAQLANGEFVSGETLAMDFGLSRTAVGKDIKLLRQWGVDIFSVKGKGYKLAQPFQPLAQDKVTHYLITPVFAPIDLHICLPSTNSFMRSCINDWQQGQVVVAEVQTDGRGRRGRQWLAPVGSGITLSVYWQFDNGHQSLTGLSLVIGVAIARALASWGISDIGLKWPNDVYLQGGKAGGVLVEIDGQLGNSAQCVIGIGLNVALPQNTLDVDQPVSDLSSVLDTAPDRNQVLANLCSNLWEVLQQFETQGFASFRDEWQQYDVFQRKAVVLSMGKHQVEGLGRGVDESGALLIETSQGVLPYHGGEASLRARDSHSF